MRSSRPRSELEEAHEREIIVNPGCDRARVLEHLAANPDTGFTPGGIAEQTGVAEDGVRKLLKGLREEDLVEVLDGYYLVNKRYGDTITDALLSADQLQVAFEISNENTAPDELPPSEFEDIEEELAELEDIDDMEDLGI